MNRSELWQNFRKVFLFIIVPSWLISSLGIIVVLSIQNTQGISVSVKDYKFLQALTDDSYVKATLNKNGEELKMSVARSYSKQATGLMNIDKLNRGEGMLFIFDDSSIRHFWMKDTFIPLDIIFLDQNLNVVNFYENTKPLDISIDYKSLSGSMFVIETNAGWASDVMLAVGDTFTVEILMN